MSLHAKVARIERRTLADRVYDDIKGMLIQGIAAPGERLTLRGMAEALGTSPMPVRDAVSRLVAESALEILPNRTVRVPVPTRAVFEELTTIRCALEGLAAESAALRRTEREVEEIEAHLRRFVAESHAPAPDIVAVVESNKDFHFAIYRAAGMPELLEMILGLWVRVGPVFNSDLQNRLRRLVDIDAHAHHARMLEGIRSGDGMLAREAVAEDIRSAARFLLSRGMLPD
jgi:DNA-binding GntR family transcriptional regulator